MAVHCAIYTQYVAGRRMRGDTPVDRQLSIGLRRFLSMLVYVGSTFSLSLFTFEHYLVQNSPMESLHRLVQYCR